VEFPHPHRRHRGRPNLDRTRRPRPNLLTISTLAAWPAPPATPASNHRRPQYAVVTPGEGFSGRSSLLAVVDILLPGARARGRRDSTTSSPTRQTH